MNRTAAIVLAVLGGVAVYELLRAGVGSSVRRRTPEILRREIAAQGPAFGILGPALGTNAVAEVVGAIAQQSIYDTLPTIVGPRAYEPLGRVPGGLSLGVQR